MIKAIWSWMGPFVIAFVCSMLIGIFIFQPYRVNGLSMDPTLSDQERIYVSKMIHTFSYLPNYGDIVVIDSRVNRERRWLDDLADNPIVTLIAGKKTAAVFYVKRVIGKPGDVLDFKAEQLYRNGKLLVEPYIREAMLDNGMRQVIVPEGHVYVMGDNRNQSRDSREIGFIPLRHVIGKKL